MQTKQSGTSRTMAFQTFQTFQETVHFIKRNSPIKQRLHLTLLYAEFISAWSNQGSVMCLLSILNQ